MGRGKVSRIQWTLQSLCILCFCFFDFRLSQKTIWRKWKKETETKHIYCTHHQAIIWQRPAYARHSSDELLIHSSLWGLSLGAPLAAEAAGFSPSDLGMGGRDCSASSDFRPFQNLLNFWFFTNFHNLYSLCFKFNDVQGINARNQWFYRNRGRAITIFWRNPVLLNPWTFSGSRKYRRSRAELVLLVQYFFGRQGAACRLQCSVLRSALLFASLWWRVEILITRVHAVINSRKLTDIEESESTIAEFVKAWSFSVTANGRSPVE